jgi:beta-phosphoglucomutase
MRAVVFDFDGVLVNSEPLHYRSLRECLLPEGIAIDEEEYLRSYLAYDDRTAIRIALERHGQACDAQRVGRIAQRKSEIFDASIPGIPFFPGARELVLALGREVPLAIASGALRREIEAILSAAGLHEAFAAIVGAEDVSCGKPDPEPYLTAMARLRSAARDLLPEECLVVEDSVAGIASARAAGMKVLAVTHSYPAAKLAGAHRVVGSLVDIEPLSLRVLFQGHS